MDSLSTYACVCVIYMFKNSYSGLKLGQIIQVIRVALLAGLICFVNILPGCP